jgi:Tfp pilus assembly major pilin PilA
VGAIVVACLLPAIMIVGIVAAIAIPAYQDYVQRAAQSEQAQ